MRKLYLIGLLFVLLVLAGCLQSQPNQEQSPQETQPSSPQPTQEPQEQPTSEERGMQEGVEETNQEPQPLLAGEKVKCILNFTTAGQKSLDATYYVKGEDLRIEQSIYQPEGVLELSTIIRGNGREVYTTLPTALDFGVNDCVWIKETYPQGYQQNFVPQVEDYIGKGRQKVTIGESVVEIECFREEFDEALLNPPTEGVCSEEDMFPQ